MKNEYYVVSYNSNILSFKYDNHHEITFVDLWDNDMLTLHECLFEKLYHAKYELDNVLDNDYSYELDALKDILLENLKIVKINLELKYNFK